MDIESIIDIKKKAGEVARLAELLELDINSNPLDPADAEQNLQDLEEAIAELKILLSIS